MKHRVCAVWIASLIAAAVTAGAADSKVRINVDEPAAPKAGTQKSGNATTPPPAPGASAAKKKAGKAKEEPPPKIDGLEISRGDRGFLGIKVDGGFRVNFYGRDRKPIAPDVDRIVLRWPVHYQPNDERATLTPAADGKGMVSPKLVRPPYRFKLYVTLLKDAAPADAETYVVDFNQ